MKTYKELLEGWRDNMSERDKAFDNLAGLQRGEPESAMRDIQRATRGGVYFYAVEHGGDLTHRMSEHTTSHNRGYDYVKPKVLSLYRTLHHPYGFEKEHHENMRSNANYNKVPHSDYVAAVHKAADQYADEHSKLKVFNEPQYHAREFAVALGRRQFHKARHHISVLKDHIDKGEDHWKYVANKYDPNYEKNK